MQVTAFKDPVTGALFPDEVALKVFQDERSKAEAAVKTQRQKAAQDALVRKLLVRKLSCREDFAALATEMYSHAISKCKQGGKGPKLKVLNVFVTDWRFFVQGASDRKDGGISLDVQVEVLLNRDPAQSTGYSTVRLSPEQVLYPFTLFGCGSGRSNKDGTFTYVYGLSARVKDLPLVSKVLNEYSESEKLAEAHLEAVSLKAATLKAGDSALASLKKNVEIAHARMVEAALAHSNANFLMLRREAELQGEAQSSIEDKNAKIAQDLRARTGLPAAGTKDYNSDRILDLLKHLRGTPALSESAESACRDD